MPVIPFKYPWRNLKTATGNDDQPTKLVNGYIDEAGGLLTSPYLSEFCDLQTGKPVSGLFYSDAQNNLFAVSDGNIYRIDSTGTATDITGTAAPTEGMRLYAADYSSTTAYGCADSQLFSLPSTGNAAQLTDTDWTDNGPYRSCAVADKYLLALKDDSEQIFYSAPADPESSIGEVFTAESRADLTQSFGWENGVLSIFGQSSTETWWDDGSTPWVRYSAGNFSRGWLAAHGQVNANAVWYGLDQSRQVSRLTGEGYEPLSLAVSKYLADFGTVEDAEASYIEHLGRPFIVWYFPTEQKTLVYDVIASGFCDWGKWLNADYLAWRGRCSAIPKRWTTAETLIGDRSEGKIWKLTSTESAEPEATRLLYRTGNMSFGSTAARKFMRRMVFRLERTQDLTPKSLLLRWRDNGARQWGEWKEIPVTESAKYGLRAVANRCGSFFTRQFELAYNDTAPLYISRWEVEF